MAKIQEIKRTNGSVVNHITLPRNVVEEAEFRKGDVLEIVVVSVGQISVKRVMSGE